MLDVFRLDFDYQDNPLLEEISFQVPAGGLLHLKGSNGAGKTTLLKLIAGLYRPTRGSISFKGQSIQTDLSSYQSQICYIGHKTGINPSLSVKEQCYFDLHYGKNLVDLIELATIFKLERQIDLPCGLLSAGQKRQVGLLRLWMSDAVLWLLDEPLVALDQEALVIIMAKIHAHREQGGCIVVTSHQSLPENITHYQEFSL